MTNIEMSLHKHRVRQKLKEEITPQASPGIYKDLSSFPVPLVVTTKTGLIEFVNNATLTLTGYAQAELTNKPITFLLRELILTQDPNRQETSSSSYHIIMPIRSLLKNGEVLKNLLPFLSVSSPEKMMNRQGTSICSGI